MDREAEGLTRQGTHRTQARPPRSAQGNPGDVRPVGKGLSELRLDVGPGYRVYYLQDGDTLILLLCGDDKSSQQKDNEKAHELADQWLADKKEAAEEKEGT